MIESQQDVLIGRDIDGYRVIEVLGRGGMGIVYKAEDVALDRFVALKVIDPALARDETFVRRFRTEARALASVQSLYIVNIHTLRQTDHGMYIVMEYVDGGTLADLIEKGPMDWERAYPIIRQMLSGFEQAHGVGVIHRDIKPRNIMLSQDGVVKVTDFGLAKLRRGDRASTVTQGTAGTLFYMSPEQVKGVHDLDHRSDVYSIGMTIYEMLTGQLPFDREAGDFTIMRTIVENKLPPPTQFRSDLPAPISRFIMKALEKDPDKRYASAREFRHALDALHEAGSEIPAAKPLQTLNRRWRAAAGAAAVLVVLLGTGYLLFGGNSPDRGATAPRNSTSTTVAELPVGSAESEQAVESADPSIDEESGQSRGRESEAAQSPAGPDDDETASNMQLGSEDEPELPVRPATVSITAADAGVTIAVNGASHPGGATLRLSPGTHDVVFRHPHYGERRERITADAGERVDLTYYFTGSVSIPTPLMDNGEEGPWAAIWIDGKTESDWFTPKTIELGPGRHTISLTKTNYEIINNNQLIEIKPGFQPSEHSLSFRMRRP